MSASNRPDPDKIPDMSLGDKIEKPSPAARPIAGDDSYHLQSESEPIAPAPAKPRRDEPAAPPNWQEGDSVLAPWEPNLLYPGVIKQIMTDEAQGDQALIAFDDGGEGWVFLYSLCPLEFTKGQQVHVRRTIDHQYQPGKILEVGEDDVRVRYEDGRDDWAEMRLVRVPCIENGPGARGTKLASWQTPPANPGATGGVPTWVIWIGIAILLAVIRIGCRTMVNN